MKLVNLCRLAMSTALFLGVLAILCNNLNAAESDWSKSERATYSYTSTGLTPGDSAYSDADVQKSHDASSGSISTNISCWANAYDDSTYDNLKAEGDIDGLIVEDELTWIGCPSNDPESHTFTCTWYETFDWSISGDAENPDWLDDGTGEGSVVVTISYASGPDHALSEYYVDFNSHSKKKENNDWISKVLSLAWDLYQGEGLEWDDEALNSDDTFSDEPSAANPKECADSEWRIRYVSNQDSNNVIASATISADALAYSQNNAQRCDADVSASISSFDLTY